MPPPPAAILPGGAWPPRVLPGPGVPRQVSLDPSRPAPLPPTHFRFRRGRGPGSGAGRGCRGGAPGGQGPRGGAWAVFGGRGCGAGTGGYLVARRPGSRPRKREVPPRAEGARPQLGAGRPRALGRRSLRPRERLGAPAGQRRGPTWCGPRLPWGRAEASATALRRRPRPGPTPRTQRRGAETKARGQGGAPGGATAPALGYRNQPTGRDDLGRGSRQNQGKPSLCPASPPAPQVPLPPSSPSHPLHSSTLPGAFSVPRVHY